ncbi:hypothetical protein GMMP15_580014 [Candidatus Magnetomoraceae bacterium gMMP-15]
MKKQQHLKLPLFQGNVERQKRRGGGHFSLPQGRNKAQFSQQARKKAKNLSSAFSALKKQISVKIDGTAKSPKLKIGSTRTFCELLTEK